MSAHTETIPDRQALRAELDRARTRRDGLARELAAVDASLDELAGEREQHALVGTACSALEKLAELGGADLFWGERGAGGNPDFHLGGVRRRLDEFGRRVGEIEHARRALLEQLRAAQDDTDILEDDVFEAQREEELRKLDWEVEREIGPIVNTIPVMPWTRSGEDDRRFRKSLAVSLLLSLLLAIVLPLVDLPLPDPWQASEVPERFARLVQEDFAPIPPPVVQEQKPEELQETASEEPVVADAPTVEKPAGPDTRTPTENAGSKGILAFREKFSSLADGQSAARLGAAARIDRGGEAAIGQRGRSLVTTQAPGSSGGIDIASIGRGSVGGGGGGDIEGVSIGRATSSIGGTGGGGGAGRKVGGGPGPGRTDEEIQIVFDRHKAALYRLYNRELRRDPTLQGQIVLRLTIEPDGTVSLCEVNGSDMKAPELAAQVAARVKGFDFGAKEGITALTILYPIDFLPAT